MPAIEGWLFSISVLNDEKGTPPIKAWWAAWDSDENAALSAVVEKIGPGEPIPKVDRTLTEKELKLMGLSQAGEVKNVRTDF
jgi:hypothetical protein